MRNLSRYNVCYDRAITRWDEALPLGNGKLGCLIYGDGPLRLAVDRVDLWDTRSAPASQEPNFNFQHLVELAKSGKKEDWEEYSRLFDRVYEDTPYPTKLTAGRIELDLGAKTQKVQSSLSLSGGVANVEIKGDKGAKLECFMSATHFVGAARFFGEYTLGLHIPDYVSGTGKEENVIGAAEQSCSSLQYPTAAIVRDGEFTYYRQETATDFCYGLVVLEQRRKNYTELYFTIATSEDAQDFIAIAKAQLKEVSSIGYERLKKEHKAWWRQYWAKSEISLGDFLLEKTYYRSWYLFASCSRKGFHPMPLQGVWTADNDLLPPWKGDYHHDTNTQLSYQAYLKANRLSEGECFIDYLWSLRGEYAAFAKDFYGVDGLLIPGVSTIQGKPMGGWAQYAFSPTMTIWTAQSFDEYYLYTGDIEFLKNRAYPFFAEIGKAILGLLEEKDGKLYLPLSSSPEIYDAEPTAYLQPNSNFDLALMRYLYKTLRSYAETLQKDAEVAYYADILSKLDDIAVIDGIIALDKTQLLPVSHRHFSHLMCLYPLHLISYDSEQNKSLYENSLVQIEELGQGFWAGFSFAMAAQIYAMAYKGNGAYERLRQFAHGFVAENGFHLNGDFKGYGYSALHYRPFTLESLFGYCDALQEMLLQEHLGFIHIFPAIPDEWKDRSISFERLRSYGGVEVSAELCGGKVQSFVLRSQKTCTIRIYNNFGKEKLCFSDGQKVTCSQGEIFTLSVKGEIALV